MADPMPVRVGQIAAAGGGGTRVVVGLGGDAYALDELVEHAPPDTRSLIADWAGWGGRLAALAAELDAPTDAARPAPLDLATVSWQAPVIPRKLFCVGTNYRDHVLEMERAVGVQMREEPFPFTFLKPVTALAGSGVPVRHPAHGVKLDWEVELGAVIGDPAQITAADPLAGVFGYTVVNDLSLRDYLPFPHTLGLEAIVAKGFDGAAPMGPWITPTAWVGDPQALALELRVGGELMQDSSTAQMIFPVARIVVQLASVLTLEPGDVIATGTPAGVGAARQPPRFLGAGDVIEATIEGLGTLVTPIQAAAGAVSLADL